MIRLIEQEQMDGPSNDPSFLEKVAEIFEQGGDGMPDDVEWVSSLEEADGYDMAVLVTAHRACVDIDWTGLLQRMNTPLLYDGRRVLPLSGIKLSSSGTS